MKKLIFSVAAVVCFFVAVGCGKKSSNNSACGYGGVWNGYTCSNAYGYGAYGNGWGYQGGVSYSMEIVAQFTSSNPSVYSNLLRANGMCSRYDINFGSEKCGRYNNSGSVVLRTNGVNGGAMVEIGSTNNQLYSNPIYAGWIPYPVANPYAAPATYSPLYASGQLLPNGSNLAFTNYNGLEILIDGTSLTGLVHMTLYYNSQPFASANGVRRL